MIAPAASVFILRELPFERFTFPRWQSAAAISLLGVLYGFDPGMRMPAPDGTTLPLWIAIAVMVLSTWVTVLLIVGVLKWWMKRGSRWDGRGDLFNLMAAAWLVVSVLVGGLVALGLPHLFTMPLWFYAVWVAANALSGAIPKASLGYSIGGVVLSLVPAIIASGVVVFGLLTLAVLAGLAPMPPVPGAVPGAVPGSAPGG